MNDDFLLNNRPDVRKSFSDHLYQQISSRYKTKETQVITDKYSRMFKWQYAIASFMIAAILLFSFSTPVRAKAMELIRMIAGFTIQEQSESPLNDTVSSETDSTIVSSSVSEMVIQPTQFPVQTKTIPTVLENPPFAFNFPTWIPEGYILDQDAGISISDSWASFEWNNPDLSEIELLVEKQYTGYTIYSGDNSSEEIEINGQPALLVRGFWNGEHQWDPDYGVVIGWEQDGHFYRLSYYQREPLHNELTSINEMDTKITALIMIADSFASLSQ